MIVLGLQGQPHAPRACATDVRGAWQSGWYHDSAAVLLVDGVVVAAIEEERLSRRKHDGRWPLRAMKACLETARCAPGAVDLFAFGEEGGQGEFRDQTIDTDELAAILREELGLGPSPRSRVRLFEHHLCHAMSAYVAAGYSDALIFTADGFGDGVAGYIVEARQQRLDVLDSIAVKDSLGGLYQAPLALLGFGAHDEFKMMGLAPYGSAQTYRAVFDRACRLGTQGRFHVDRAALSRGLSELGPPRRTDDAFSDRDCDVAAAAQAALERIVLHVLEYHQKRTGQRRLCAAGGVMQNCSLNGRLARSGLFDHVFVQPASADSGLALGAAYMAYLQDAPEGAPAIRPQPHVFLGRAVPDESAIAALLRRWDGFLSFEKSDDIARDTAALLASGHVVGWVQGRAEFGPRALGNRSILADPRDASNKDRINAMVKKRESFRPFAPAVRSEDAARYFEIPRGAACSFMTIVVPVKEAFRASLPATTHVDGSARVQVVNQADNPLFWDLIGAFGVATGVPVVLNTSFNNNHEPIVDSVDDAVACFLTTELDELVIGPYIARKSARLPANVLQLVPHLSDGACVVMGCGDPSNSEAVAFHLLLTGNRQTPISAAAHRALMATCSPCCRATERQGGRDHDMDDAGAKTLALELLSLWEQRVIHMRPATVSLGKTRMSPLPSMPNRTR